MRAAVNGEGPADNAYVVSVLLTVITTRCTFGAPYEGVLSNINIDDIEAAVLKDASATAIYGARGTNGVVLITYKAVKELEQCNVYAQTRREQPRVAKLSKLNAYEYMPMM